jgi:hypothetical protein
MNAAFDTRKLTFVVSVAELVLLRSLAAKQDDSLGNYIRKALGFEPALIGRPAAYDRQVREDQAIVYLRRAGLNDQQIAAYFSDIELPAGQPKPKVETGHDTLPIPAEGPLSTQQLLALGVLLNEYTARCRAAEAAGEEKPECPPELQRYLKNRSV